MGVMGEDYEPFMTTDAKIEAAHSRPVEDVPLPLTTEAKRERDRRPHSRACGITPHDHGPACSRDCPTCGGQDSLPQMGDWVDPPNPQHHPCVLPPFTYADAARTWRCKECGAEWTLHRSHTAANLEAAVKDMQAGRPPVALAPDKSFPAVVTREEVAEADRYAPTDLYGPNAAPQPLPEANLTLLSLHSPDCAHRLGAGMCSCEQRKTL